MLRNERDVFLVCSKISLSSSFGKKACFLEYKMLGLIEPQSTVRNTGTPRTTFTPMLGTGLDLWGITRSLSDFLITLTTLRYITMISQTSDPDLAAMVTCMGTNFCVKIGKNVQKYVHRHGAYACVQSFNATCQSEFILWQLKGGFWKGRVNKTFWMYFFP